MAIAILIFGGIFLYNEISPVPQNIWPDNSQSPRNPASVFPNLNIAFYEDFISPQSDYKAVKQNLDISFWTDKDGDYLKEKARDSLRQALAKTFYQLSFSKSNNDKFFLIFKESLLEKILKNFIYTLKIYKIVDGTFRVDFNFTKEMTPNVSPLDELYSNQIINYAVSGGLYQQMQAKQQTLPEKIIYSKIPKTAETYQFMGGVITFTVEILNIQSGLFKGTLRIRKFLRINEISDISFDTNDEFVRTKTFHLKKKNDENELFLTVDLYKNFELNSDQSINVNNVGGKTKDIAIVNDRIEFHFGDVLSSSDEKVHGILQRIISIFSPGKDISTFDFNIEGKIKIEGREKEFRSTLKTLVYDFKQKSFTSESRLTSRIKYYDASPIEKDLLEYDLKKSFFIKDGSNIIKNLKLDQIYDQL